MPIDMEGKCPLALMGMSETDKLLHEIDAFLRERNMAETTFGRKAVNDGKLVARLRAGSSVTLKTASQIKAFIASASKAAADTERPPVQGAAA